jgi:hypothetical protein
MFDTETYKKAEKNRYQSESGFYAAIPQHPHRKMAPKRQVKVHISHRVKKGPLESKG